MTTRFLGLKLSLASGALLAAALVVNSTLNYRRAVNRIEEAHTRRQLSQQVTALESEARRDKATLDSLPAFAAEFQRDRGAQIAWIRVFDREGNVYASTGAPGGLTFPLASIDQKLRARAPVTEVRQIQDARVVVEAMPFRLPSNPGEPRRMLLVEMALFAQVDPAVFWPLRWNLAVTWLAGGALMAALALIALRFRAYVNGRRLEQQVEIASQVQQDLFPRETCLPSNVDLAARSVAAWQVGGDFYDAFEIPDGRAGLVLGDVSGKGIPAALLMGVIHGAVRSSRWAEGETPAISLAAHLNKLLCEHSSKERYATMFWCGFDPLTGKIEYVNAGHCPPLVIHRNGRGPKVTRLQEGGPVLGLLPGARYTAGCERLGPGDCLVLYSDGIAEAVNGNGEEFGEDRLEEILLANTGKPAEQIRKAVFDSVNAFVGSAKLADDLTLLVMRPLPVAVETAAAA